MGEQVLKKRFLALLPGWGERLLIVEVLRKMSRNKWERKAVLIMRRRFNVRRILA